MLATLVGKKIGVNSKTGKPSCNYFIKKEFSAYDASNAVCEGFVTESYYSGIDFPNIKAGDRVNLEFEPGFQGQATLVNITAVKQ